MSLPKGTLLRLKRYQITKLLTRGGFGFIYLAHDRLTGRQVAIKELIPELVNDAQVLRRFVREGRTLQRLRHLNLVQTEAMFREYDNYYLVMEYLSGGSLADRMEAGQKWEPTAAIRIMVALCDALQYLHHTGITHCDLQPGNILFDDQNRPRLIDLGIAHVSDLFVHRPWRTEQDVSLGTIFYMAPEQLDGVRDDPRIDLYALGALLYQMLAGQPYLDFDLRNTPGARADNVNRVRQQMPADIPDIPPALNRVILTALAKQPNDRYPDVITWAQELTHVAMPFSSADADGESIWVAHDEIRLRSRPPAPDWPSWIWPTLLVANLGVMLLAALLLLGHS